MTVGRCRALLLCCPAEGRGEGARGPLCRVGAHPAPIPHPLQLSFPSASIRASFLSLQLKISFFIHTNTGSASPSPQPLTSPPPNSTVPFAGAFSAALGVVGSIGVPSRAASHDLPTQWGSVAMGCQAGVGVPKHRGPPSQQSLLSSHALGP